MTSYLPRGADVPWGPCGSQPHVTAAEKQASAQRRMRTARAVWRAMGAVSATFYRPRRQVRPRLVSGSLGVWAVCILAAGAWLYIKTALWLTVMAVMAGALMVCTVAGLMAWCVTR